MQGFAFLPPPTQGRPALRHGRVIAVLFSVLLALQAGAASATTYYVSLTGSDGNAGTSSAAAWRTIGKANATLRAGDVAMILPGTYAESINPANSGAAGSYISYVGNILNPTAVTLNDISLSADDYISVKGVSTNGGLSLTANGQGNAAFGDSVVSSVIRGGMSVTGAWNCVVQRNSIGTPNSTSTKWLIDAYPPNSDPVTYQLLPPASITKNCTFSDNTMYFGSVTGSNAISFAHNRDCTFQRNRIFEYLGSSAASTHPFIGYRIKGNRFEDNHWQLLTHMASDAYIMNLRDSSRFNTWTRDTFYVDPASTGHGKMVFATSGSFPGTCGYNRWERCFASINGIFMHQSQVKGDQFVGNIFIAQNAFNPWGDSLQVVHNTFYNTGALTIDVSTSNALTNTTWRYNIFYSGAAGTHNYLRTAGAANINYNLYYSPAEDSTRATMAGSVGAGSSWCSTNGMDCNSRWGNPRLASPVALGGNFHPLAGSIALSSALWPDGYVGALAADVPDATPPGNVTNLAMSQIAQNSMMLSWTSPGDDGFGGGLVSAYELRTSTQPINAGNFASATLVSPQPLPALPGTMATYVLLGLSPTTTYYVALRARDDAGNWSGISNVPTGTTTASDVTAPAVIPDLVAVP